MGREAHREGGWKNDSERETKRERGEREEEEEKEDHLIRIDAQDGCYAVCWIDDCWGQICSRISFRSDDDNDDVPLSSISTQLRRYDFLSTISTIQCLPSYCCSCLFFLIATRATITLLSFFANI